MPVTWKVFLADQRGPRRLTGALTDRALSLRTGRRDLTREEMEARELVRWKAEEMDRKDAKRRRLMEKEQQDTEIPFVDIEEDGEDTSEVNEVEDDSDDSDWEDIPEEKENNTRKQNNLELKNFAREVDRYQISDRGAAKVANGLLKDLGLVRPGKTDLLIGPSKVRRQRKKWGTKLELEHLGLALSQGLYTDGKKVPTLVRDDRETKVQVPGRRGRGAYRTVTTTSNKLEVQDHYPIVSEPGGEYVTHVTPNDGTGKSIAKEVVTVVRERDMRLRVLGLDGCPVNTGIHNGVTRWVELELGETVQHIVCILHFNELFLHHIFADADGVTLAPGTLFLSELLKDVQIISH